MNPQVTLNLPFDIRLSDTLPPGVPAEMAPVIAEMFNAFQQLQYVMHTYLGIGQRIQSLWPSLSYSLTLHRASQGRFYALASEAITYGAAVNLHPSGGVLKIRNANATNNTKPCFGFCTAIGGIASGATGEVILFSGLLTGVSGLTIGTRYFLSTTNGLITATDPVVAGAIGQAVGIAVDTTALLFQIDLNWIQH